MKETNGPDYKKIFEDILMMKFPKKADSVMPLISGKKELSYLEVIKINNLIFGVPHNNMESQKYKCYDRKTILAILDFQKQKGLNNQQLAIHFKLSRNTVARWKKIFI